MASMQTLRLNARGDDVKIWQAFLRDQGLFTGPIDGSFGPHTLESTKAFQRAHALQDDGVVGSLTLAEAERLGLHAAAVAPTLPDTGPMNRPWTAPEPPPDADLFVTQDPRVITDHQVGVLPCPSNPPPPVGWAYWKGPVPAPFGELAVEIEHDSSRFPMGSFVQAMRGGERVAARVEWHDFKGRTGEHGCFRGTNLFRPSSPV